MQRELRIAWAAGIFDGEGCITINCQQPGSGGRINPSYRLYLKVTMGHRATVDCLCDLFSVGTVTIQHSNAGHNDAYTWWVASRQAIEVIKLMRPYLVTKADEADLALEWSQLPLANRGGRGGGQPLPASLLAERHRLFELMRDAKPSARFRAARKEALNA